METSINLDLDDLMEPMDDVDDELPVLSTLPALDDENDNWAADVQRGEGSGLLDSVLDPGGGEEGGETKTRIVNRKPIPKLDAARLTSDRGLPALMKHFEKVKFKGKGHETADLDTLMRSMEHWAHRLFPKMPFDDVIERIQKLGSKKPVQTCLKKIRLDMPLLDEDFVTRVGDGEGDENDIPKDVTSQQDDFSPQHFGSSQQASNNTNTPKLALTDEQKERIERNKKLAMERRITKEKKDATSNQQVQESDGLTQDEVDALFATETGKKRVDDDGDGIDSDEADLENEMWSQIMGTGQEKCKEKSLKKSNQISAQAATAKKRRIIEDDDDVDSDDAEMENEMWSQITGITQEKSKEKSSKESSKISTQAATAKKRKIIEDDDVDSDEAEMENEMWSQMTKTNRSEANPDSKIEKRQSQAVKRGIDGDSDNDSDSKIEKRQPQAVKRVIDDNSDDDEMEKVLPSQGGDDASQSMNADKEVEINHAKRRRIIEDDDDDDDEANYNVGSEDNSSSQITSTSQKEQDTESRNTQCVAELDDDVKTSKSKKRQIIDDDDDDDVDDDGKEKEQILEETDTPLNKDRGQINEVEPVIDDKDKDDKEEEQIQENDTSLEKDKGQLNEVKTVKEDNDKDDVRKEEEIKETSLNPLAPRF